MKFNPKKILFILLQKDDISLVSFVTECESVYPGIGLTQNPLRPKIGKGIGTIEH